MSVFYIVENCVKNTEPVSKIFSTFNREYVTRLRGRLSPNSRQIPTWDLYGEYNVPFPAYRTLGVIANPKKRREKKRGKPSVSVAEVILLICPTDYVVLVN